MRSHIPKRKFTAADLVPGISYRVVSAFQDFDGTIHGAGECWRFVRRNFLPYDDGLSLFVEKDGREVQIRLQWRPEAQGKVIEAFSDLVEAV